MSRLRPRALTVLAAGLAFLLALAVPGQAARTGTRTATATCSTGTLAPPTVLAVVTSGSLVCSAALS